MDPQLLLPLDKLGEGCIVVDERLERVLVRDEVEAGDEVRELLREREAVLEVPLELVRLHVAQGRVDDFGTHELVLAPLRAHGGSDFVEDALEDLEPDTMGDILFAVLTDHVSGIGGHKLG